MGEINLTFKMDERGRTSELAQALEAATLRASIEQGRRGEAMLAKAVKAAVSAPLRRAGERGLEAFDNQQAA